MKNNDHLNKISILLLTFERHLFFKKQLNYKKNEKVTKNNKHSNLIRAIRQ